MYSTNDSPPGLSAYLRERSSRGGALYELLRDPDPERGLAHTPREIAQQPFLWRTTARMMRELAPDLRGFLSDAGLFSGRCPSAVIFTGAGSSDYVGLSVVDLLRRQLRVPCGNWPSTRLLADPDTFYLSGEQIVQFHVGRSGNSPESVTVLKRALRDYPDHVRHVVITCNREGALAECARSDPERIFPIILDDACNDRGLAMTSSFSNMLLASQAVAFLEDMDRVVDVVDRLAEAAEYLMHEYADRIRELADPTLSRAFYLGNGDLFGAAIESALKVQELTIGEMIGKGEDTLAFRHGPISAVDAESMVAFYLSSNERARRYELDVITQYQDAFEDMGVRTVVLSDHEPDVRLNDSIHQFTYDAGRIHRIPPLLQANLAVVFGQLFGLFASQRRSLNVDDPSVDKALYSRTVEGVRIYESV